MFKKLKDKITEEVKIPSTKFTQSMQQLAQAVVSPSSNNNSSFDHASNDNFSIGGDFDDTPQNSPVKSSSNNESGVAYRGGVSTPLGVVKDTGAAAGFTLVDLQQDSPTQKPSLSTGGLGILNEAFSSLRRSSISSSTSDSSFMFPTLESSGPTYNFHSDLESCSETSESVGPNINKEQLLQAYQKIQQRYQKYKGRYADLARHYRELERENLKAKNILAECQDKALRRMSELKEQCLLEKQAKAHLEEALRSDLEEKDHLIHTLETKIKLLKTSVDHLQSSQGEHTSSTSGVSTQGNSETSAEVSPLHSGQEQEDLLSCGGEVLTPEPAVPEIESVFKEKVKKLETLLLKCREDISSKCELIKSLETDKQAASATIQALQEQLTAVRKCEEEASLSLAKNKLSIHRELEAKEEEIKKLHAQVTSATSRITELQEEIVQITEASKKDLAIGKLEATRLIQAEMQQLVTNNETLRKNLDANAKDLAAKEAELAQTAQLLKNTQDELSVVEKNKQKVEEKCHDDVKSLQHQISQGKNFRVQLKHTSDALHELRSNSEDFRRIVANVVSEAQHFSKISLEQVLSTITKLASENAQKLNDMCSERDGLKCELEGATATCQDLNKKLGCLEEKQAKESLEVHTLKQELAAVKTNLGEAASKLQEAEEKADIEKSLLKKQLSSKEISETSMKQKLISLEQLLSQEQEKLQHSSSLQSKIEDLHDKLGSEEQNTTHLLEQISSLESRISSLVEQCHKGEDERSKLMLQIDNLKFNLMEKEKSLEDLEASFTALEVSFDTASSALLESEEKLKTVSADLELQTQGHKTSAEKTADLEDEIFNLRLQLDRSKDYASQLLEDTRNIEKKQTTQEEENKNLISEKEVLCSDLEEKTKVIKDLEYKLADLQSTQITLQSSLGELQLELEAKSSQLGELESLNKDQHEKMLQSADISDKIRILETELGIKIKSCSELELDLQRVKSSLIEQENLLAARTSESNTLSQQMERLILENKELKSGMDKLLHDQFAHAENLKCKTEECMKLESQLAELHLIESKGASELKKLHEEDLQLSSKLQNLKIENDSLSSTLQSKTSEINSLTEHLSSIEEKLANESKLLKVKNEDYNALLPKIDVLTAENTRLSDLLKQKVGECEEKEEQLDNLADEMKRVEELSQELHRINDDRDANVEVLSSEASSLAQKVEELTVMTQEMKEREVQLLNKIQLAQDLEDEYLSLKEKEKALTLKLKELEGVEEKLEAKCSLVDELLSENKKLKEAGKNLNELVARTKEAEAKCMRLQEDGAIVLSRIQKAEESEIKYSLLEEELMILREERAQLQAKLDSLKVTHAETDGKQIINAEEICQINTMDSKDPVIEEPCIAKHYAVLTEENLETTPDDEKIWENKYNKLFEEHKAAMQKNADIIQKLKGKDLRSNESNSKSKQWLWDREGAETPLDMPVSIERLQQQLASTTVQLKEAKKQHRQEVADLRRILLNHGSGNSFSMSRPDNLEDATELEYLRNILFEYMMGKEPLVLARVIAAVVKFDSDQTHKVLQKEQQRLTLLGQLGIS